MAELSRFDALVFDLDGVIVDTESSIHGVWTLIFSEFGCTFSEAEWHEHVGSNTGYLVPYTWLVERATAPVPSLDDVHRMVSSRHRSGVDLLGPMPGVVQWLDAAIEQRLLLAVASSSPLNWVEGRLGHLGLLDRFDAVACPDGHVRPKPAPDLYLAACAALAVAPERALAVEDSANGVASAVTAGLCCIAVPNAVTASMDLSRAHCRLDSLSTSSLIEVLALLDGVGRPPD